jgi:TRAP-type mannitol/chloroaromatic compound transport system permease small subunit
MPQSFKIAENSPADAQQILFFVSKMFVYAFLSMIFNGVFVVRT